MSRQAHFMAVRAQIAASLAGGGASDAVAPFGDARLDGRLPGGGLPLGRWPPWPRVASWFG